MMQKIRNRLPKLFRKNEKDKPQRQSDFDLANTLILLLSQKMQQLSHSKKIIEQQRHAYYFKNGRRSQTNIGNETYPLQQCVGDRQLRGGHQFEKGLSQRASRLSLPPIPHTVNYSWLFDTEETNKLNCFERAKIRDQCGQLTMDQSVLAYEIFLKRSERITEPTELPKILNDILNVLLSRKPVRKNCIEVFKKRMESETEESAAREPLPEPVLELTSSTMLPMKERSTRSFRMKDALKFSATRSASMPLCRDNTKRIMRDAPKEQEQEQGEEEQEYSAVQSVSSQILTALDKIRVVYVQSKGEDVNGENKCTTAKKLRFGKKPFRMSDGDIRNTPVTPAVKESSEAAKELHRKVDRSKVKDKIKDTPSSSVSENPSSMII